jgi:hypothetical protein
VEEIAARAVPARGVDRLEDPAVDAHRVTAGAERNPVQTDGRRRWWRRPSSFGPRAHRRIGVNPTDPAASYGFALTIGWPAMKRLA